MSSKATVKTSNQLGVCLKDSLTGLFTDYETSKVVVIHSFKYTSLLRLMQILLLIYSVIYLLIYEKGYQKQTTTIISSVTLKVKGIGRVSTPQNQTLIVDVADYIIPASENDAMFIMTNFIQTEQKRSTCPESTFTKEARCQNDSDCIVNEFIADMNGHWTGRCLFTSRMNNLNGTGNRTNMKIGLCEYEGWCPPEDDMHDPMPIQGVLSFRIFIKNFVEFPTFGVKHKNMIDDLKPCLFDPVKDKDCPIFSIGYIIDQAEKDSNERDLMLRYGGVIGVKIDWDCNLDRNIKLCKPEYTFARLDVPYREKPFSVGFNFRFASTWKDDEDFLRILTKAYGLRLIVVTSGKAGKFDLITLSLNIGSCVGIFGLATIICDAIILHLSRKAHLYRTRVIEKVNFKNKSKNGQSMSNNATKNYNDMYCDSNSEQRRELDNMTLSETEEAVDLFSEHLNKSNKF